MKEQWKLGGLNLQMFAEGDPDPKPGDGDPNPKPPEGDPNANDPNPKPDKTFSQKELDDILTKRLARERKAWETTQEEEKKKAAMTEAEKLKAEKEEAERKSTEVLKTANQRLIRAEVKSACVELGIVDADAAFLLMGKDGVEVTDGGDITGVKEALKALAEAKPYLVKQGNQPPGPGPLNPNNANNSPKDQSKMTDAEWYEQRKATKK
jgi:hypothetical protein